MLSPQHRARMHVLHSKLHTVKSVIQQLTRGSPGTLPAALLYDHIESAFSISAMLLLDSNA